jgi:hypothetical protein
MEENMGRKHGTAFSRHELPELCIIRVPLENRGRRECRMLDAPAALRAMEESTQASHHRYAETIRHSLRDGLTAYPALSPVYRAL